MKTFKEFETIVAASTKQELFSAKQLTSTCVYKYAIDYYDNLTCNANYFAVVTKDNKLYDWHCFYDYENAMQYLIDYIK